MILCVEPIAPTIAVTGDSENHTHFGHILWQGTRVVVYMYKYVVLLKGR